MDCRHARLLLEFTRPPHAELEVGETELLENHLADCPECGPLAQHERLADEHLGRAMRDVRVPDTLRQRLLSRLAVERDAWYRRWVVRIAGVLLAVAAVALLLSWRSSLRPGLDPEELVQVGEGDQPSASPEDVGRWFKEKHGLDVVLPGDVDFTYFSHCGVVEYRGKRVPVLTFAYNGNDRLERARVYIVTDKQFDDLEEQVNQPARAAMGFEIKVKANPNNPHVYYMRVYTQGAASRFFLKFNRNPAA
jgi:hypothetical protein